MIPSPLAGFAASLTTAGKGELQEILATAPVLERLKKVIVLLKKERGSSSSKNFTSASRLRRR